MRRRWGWCVPSGVVLLVLAGCGSDDDEPRPGVTASASASATAEPTGVSATPTITPEPLPEPTRPPDMDRDDIQGATAAAVYFMEIYTYMYQTGDIGTWESASLASCNFCSASAGHVSELYGSSGRAEGGGFAVNDIVAAEPTSDYSHYRVMLIGVEEPSVELSSEGDVLQELSGATGSYNFAVLVRDGEWRIGGVSVDEDMEVSE